MSRPDLTFLREAVGLGSVFDAVVSRLDESRGLIELAFEGGVLLAPARDVPIGMPARIRIPAREVILATGAPEGLSLHNVLSGTVSAIHAEAGVDRVVIQLSVGGVRLLAEVTRDAVSRLGIAVGLPLQALIKSVSIEVQAAEPNPPRSRT
jgi:molybdate transport system ATP-binding protein